MAFVETTIGDVNVIMEAYDYNLSGLAETDNSESSTKILSLFEDASRLVNSIATNFSQKLKECVPSSPDEIKIGFSIGATTEQNLLVVKGSGELTIDVEMTWKKEEDK